MLGAIVMYGSGEQLSDKGVVFAGQVINMYTTGIGSWAYFVIALAALTTMFSTTITCLDAFPRGLRECMVQLNWTKTDEKSEKYTYWFWILIAAIGTSVVLSFFLNSMKDMVDLATTISFVTTPILAILNYMVVTSKNMPAEARPGKGLITLSWIGMVFLGIFSFVFIWWRFF